MAASSSTMVAFTRYDEVIAAPNVALVCEAYRHADGTGAALMLRGRRRGSGLVEQYLFEAAVEGLSVPGLPSSDAPYGSWQLKDLKVYIDEELQGSLRAKPKDHVAELFGYTAVPVDGKRLHRGYGTVAGRERADGVVTESSRAGIVGWIDSIRRDEELRLVAGFWMSGKVLTAVIADLHQNVAEETAWTVKFAGFLASLIASDNTVHSTKPWTRIANPWH
jgi:hypothetical protein